MKSFLKIFITLMAGVFIVSCDDEYGPRKESTPVIQSAAVSPANFTFGERVTLTAQITDPATTLTTLDYTIHSGGKAIVSGVIPINEGSSASVSEQIFVPLTSEQPDNAPVTVSLTAKNVLKGVTETEVSGITGQRPAFSRLYLVTNDGSVANLTPQASNRDLYEATGLTLERAFNYRIAERLTGDQQIDYDGAVWGNVNGRLAMIDANGEAAFTHSPNSDYTQTFSFDNYAFSATATGKTLGDDDIALSVFDEVVYDGEEFKTMRRTLVKNREYALIGALGDDRIVYHLDFFERTAVNKVRFLGETGDYTIYYNTLRQHVVVGVDNPAYPDYLLITGGGIGYPTKMLSGSDRAHCWWGFGNVRNFILMRKLSDDVFQATIFIHYDEWNWVGFKPYLNTGWGGDSDTENSFSAFTVTGEDVLQGEGNWEPKENIDTEAVYRLTINWTAKTVHVEKVIL